MAKRGHVALKITFVRLAMAHSSPFSVPLQVGAGILAGEIVREVVRECGGGEALQRIGLAAGHGLASGFVGVAVNGSMLDPVSMGTITPGVASTGAALHYLAS